MHLHRLARHPLGRVPVLEDDDGFTEVTLFDGTCAQVPYLTMGPYVAMGVIEERFGAYVMTARRFDRLDGGG